MKSRDHLEQQHLTHMLKKQGGSVEWIEQAQNYNGLLNTAMNFGLHVRWRIFDQLSDYQFFLELYSM
jgi:hypothetical protein